MFTLHIANKNYSTWSLRAWSLLKTLGIPFTENQHMFPADGPSYPEFSKFSPTGFVPILDDGAIKVWDSLAIALHVAETHPEVWPADVMARSWARSAAAEMHSGFSALRNQCGMNVGIRCKQPAIDAALQGNLDRLDALWGDGLDRFGGPCLVGQAFTATDAFFCPVAFRIQTYDLPLSARSLDYVKRLIALPSMQEWYAAGIAEPFREPGHEAETTLAHEVIADYRAKPKA
ncbi:MAG: glutathione S-transferase family protein [Devosia sp.]